MSATQPEQLNQSTTVITSQQVAYYPPTNPPPYDGPPGPLPPGGYYGPPPPAMLPGMVYTTHVGSKPTVIVCRSCNIEIMTKIQFQPSMRTHLMALLLCIFGCWPCICIPYCIETCNNIDHFCPNCNSFIGSYQN